MTRVLVAGNGMTTDRLLDELDARGALDRLAVTVVSEESFGAYNRILLSKVLEGADPDTVITKPLSWYAERNVTLIGNRRVQRLDVAARVAHIGNGETVSYDAAVIATGSRPFLPPVAGIHGPDGQRTQGVHVFRWLDDALALRDQLASVDQSRHVVVIGGGLLGLEAAVAAAGQGHAVRLVHPLEHLLNAQLDETGGRMLRHAIEQRGVKVAVGMLEGVLHRPGPGGQARAEAVALVGGERLPADTVIFATGVRPCIDVAVESGIETNRGIVVDDRLATSAPGVYAVGECAEHRGSTAGLVAPCWEQAAVLADLLAGTDPGARYPGTATYSRLKVAGVEVASLGEPDAADGDEVVEILERRRGIYRKLIIRQGRLTGAMLVGDATAAPNLIRLVERGDNLPASRLDVFCSAAAYRAADADEALCMCNRVSETQVLIAIAHGHETIEAVGAATRAGTGCGSCLSSIRRLLERTPVAAA